MYNTLNSIIFIINYEKKPVNKSLIYKITFVCNPSSKQYLSKTLIEFRIIKFQ